MKDFTFTDAYLDFHADIAEYVYLRAKNDKNTKRIIDSEHLVFLSIGLGVFTPNSKQHLMEELKKYYDASVDPFEKICTLIDEWSLSSDDSIKLIDKGIQSVKRLQERYSEISPNLEKQNQSVPQGSDFMDKSPISKKIKQTYKPTDEQEQLVEFVSHSDESLNLQGYAGCGKSTAIIMAHQALSESNKKSSLYLAFNKGMVNKMAASEPSINAKTIDSLGFAQGLHSSPWSPDLIDIKNTDINQLRDVLGIRSNQILEGCKLKGNKIAWLAREVVFSFVNDAKETIEDSHIPSNIVLEQDRQSLLAYAKALWDIYVVSPTMLGDKPIKPNFLTKWWSLNNGRIPDYFERVFVDEAQDLNGPFLSILKNSKQKVIACGDQYQELYRWRGAVNAMKSLAAKEAALTQSFRYGESIAEIANFVLGLLSSSPKDKIESFDASKKSKVLQYNDAPPVNIDVLLTRSRALIYSHAKRLCDVNVTFHLNLEFSEFSRLLLSALALYEGNHFKNTHPLTNVFEHWYLLESFAESAMDNDLKLCIKIVTENHKTLEEDLKVISKNNLPREKNPQVILSTTHKIKGRDWDNVALAEDFSYIFDNLSKDDEKYDDELQVLYVAITRAKNKLYISSDLLSKLKDS